MVSLEKARSRDRDRLLIVVDGEEAEVPVPGLLPGEEFKACSFAQLDSALIERLDPSVVVSLLVLDKTDAVEIAARLHSIGYRGRYRILMGGVPDRSLIRAELAAVAPGLTIELLDLGPEAG
ncbi:hypothetical protein [Pseudoroseicyclus aestuarii]|uniref:Uncharacterized protein n=1 Tax=Pseudoroseicyclus aestuarii TaxID=1795041 RepID=A0A318SXF7_9RHOB|nr:hypothetical protein [Pseudoroseicyclus aestuarii]PYE86112.1 hypothetical protein DFP88_101788 [Pseudoroseicyclus aestuarii]